MLSESVLSLLPLSAYGNLAICGLIESRAPVRSLEVSRKIKDMEINKLLLISEEEFKQYKIVREQFQNLCSKYKDHLMMRAVSDEGNPLLNGKI